MSSTAGATSDDDAAGGADAAGHHDVVPIMPLRRRARVLRNVVGHGNGKLISALLVLLIVNSVSGAGQSLALKWIVDGAVGGDVRLATTGAIVGAVATAAISVVGRVTFELPGVVGAQAGLALDRQTLGQTSGIPGSSISSAPNTWTRWSWCALAADVWPSRWRRWPLRLRSSSGLGWVCGC